MGVQDCAKQVEHAPEVKGQLRALLPGERDRQSMQILMQAVYGQGGGRSGPTNE